MPLPFGAFKNLYDSVFMSFRVVSGALRNLCVGLFMSFCLADGASSNLCVRFLMSRESLLICIDVEAAARHCIVEETLTGDLSVIVAITDSPEFRIGTEAAMFTAVVDQERKNLGVHPVPGAASQVCAHVKPLVLPLRRNAIKAHELSEDSHLIHVGEVRGTVIERVEALDG